MPRASLRCGRKKIFVAPLLHALVVDNFLVLVADEAEGLVEGKRVRVVLRAAAIEHRRQVGAAAEPLARGHHHAGVHVDGRHIRVLRMRDQRNAACPVTRVFLGARNLLAELRRELAIDRRDMDADLFEDAAMHDRHDPRRRRGLHPSAMACGRSVRVRDPKAGPAIHLQVVHSLRRYGRAVPRTSAVPPASSLRCLPG